MKIFILPMAIGLSVSLLQGANYKGVGDGIGDSKKEACTKALNYAKEDALNQGGSSVISEFSSNETDKNGKLDSSIMMKVKAKSIGVVKVLDKKEKVVAIENYQFKCSVNADFDIDLNKMALNVKELGQEQKKELDKMLQGYFEAEAYSEEGQSKFRATRAAKVLAQRELLEVIKGSELTTMTVVQDGILNSDEVATHLNGVIRGAQEVEKSYDKNTRSATVKLRISKKDVYKSYKALYR